MIKGGQWLPYEHKQLCIRNEKSGVVSGSLEVLILVTYSGSRVNQESLSELVLELFEPSGRKQRLRKPSGKYDQQ